MGMTWYQARRAEKPITGFGWRGWLALAVFFGILIPHLAGFDWQFLVLETIWRIWDWPALYYLVPRQLGAINATFYASFGPQSGLVLLAAMRIAPVRFGLVRYGVIFVAVLVACYHQVVLRDLGLWWAPANEWLPIVVPFVVGGCAAWYATGSWKLGMLWLAMLPIGLLEPVLMHAGLDGGLPLFGLFGSNVTASWSWSAMLLFAVTTAVTLRWSVRLRRALDDAGLCRQCGYPNDGLASNICPECGVGLV